MRERERQRYTKIYRDTERERERYKEKDRQRKRDRDRERERLDKIGRQGKGDKRQPKIGQTKVTTSNPGQTFQTNIRQ